MKENLKKTEPTPELLDIGLIGLSVMGRSLALNMADHGFQVAGYNRSPEVTQKVMEEHPHDSGRRARGCRDRSADSASG